MPFNDPMHVWVRTDAILISYRNLHYGHIVGKDCQRTFDIAIVCVCLPVISVRIVKCGHIAGLFIYI